VLYPGTCVKRGTLLEIMMLSSVPAGFAVWRLLRLSVVTFETDGKT